MKTLARLVLGATLICATPLAVVGQQPEAPKIARLAHKGSRSVVAFSPDSKTLATGGEDGYIRFWDLATGKEKEKSAFRAGRVGAQATQLYYMPDGKSLASTVWSDTQGWAGVVKIWEQSSGKETRVIRGEKRGAELRAASPDGKFFALTGSGGVHLYDVAMDRATHKLPTFAAVDSAVFSWDNKWLATASGGGKVQIWDVATGKQVHEIDAKQIVWSGSQAVAFTPDNKILATASAKIRLWNTTTGEEITSLGPEKESQSHIAISKDGRFLASSAMSPRTLRLWDLKTHKLVHSWDVSAFSSQAISPDGNWLAFCDWSDSGVGLIKIGVAK